MHEPPVEDVAGDIPPDDRDRVVADAGRKLAVLHDLGRLPANHRTGQFQSLRTLLPI